MITRITLSLQTRFDDEDRMEEALVELMGDLITASDGLVTGYEVQDTVEEDIEPEEDPRPYDSDNDPGELPF